MCVLPVSFALHVRVARYLLGIRSPGTQEPLPPQWSVYVLTSSLVDRLQRAHNPDASSTQSPLEFLGTTSLLRLISLVSSLSLYYTIL